MLSGGADPDFRQSAGDRGNDRTFHHDPARDRGRCGGDRAAARAHFRSRPARQDGLSDPRGRRASTGAVVHRAHRHALDRIGAAYPRPYRRGSKAPAPSPPPSPPPPPPPPHPHPPRSRPCPRPHPNPPPPPPRLAPAPLPP